MGFLGLEGFRAVGLTGFEGLGFASGFEGFRVVGSLGFTEVGPPT